MVSELVRLEVGGASWSNSVSVDLFADCTATVSSKHMGRGISRSASPAYGEPSVGDLPSPDGPVGGLDLGSSGIIFQTDHRPSAACSTQAAKALTADRSSALS